MRFVHEDVRVDVGRVDPVAAEVLRQSASGLHHLGLHRSDAHPLGRFLRRLQSVAFGGDGDTNVQIIVTILQEAAVLLVLSTLLRVRDGEVVILPDEPVAQAAVLDDAAERARHALALLVRDVELLIGDQELRSGRLARANLRVLVIAFSGETEAVLRDKIQRLVELHGQQEGGRGLLDRRTARRPRGRTGN